MNDEMELIGDELVDDPAHLDNEEDTQDPEEESLEEGSEKEEDWKAKYEELQRGYTQARQQEKDELRALRAEIEAIKGGKEAEEVAGDDIIAAVEKEWGLELTESEGQIVKLTDTALRSVMKEIADLKAMVAPVVGEHKTTAQEREIVALLKEESITATPEQVRAALKATGGDQTKAVLKLSKTTPAPKPKPATVGSGRDGGETDFDKMTEAQRRAHIAAILRNS